MKHVKRLRKKLYALKQEENIVFVHGIGKRKTRLQKNIETLEDYLDRLKGYTKKLHICGKRNSYSKTDPDATFMRMKEDAMGNGQLKPVFNLQHGVDSEYIVWLTVGPQPTDTQFWIVLKYGFFTKKTIVSIDTAQLYRENREKGSCRFTIY